MGAFGTAFTLASKFEVVPITIYNEFTNYANFALAASLSIALGLVTWAVLFAGPALRRATPHALRHAMPCTAPHAPAPFLLTVTRARRALFMLAPMLLSVMAGLVNNYSVGLKSGLTLRWLGEVWEVYGNTVGWSLALGAGCVVGTLLLGVPCAYALARSRTRAARAFEELLTLPVAVPGLATALALILAYGQLTAFRQSFAFILVGPHRVHAALHGAHRARRPSSATSCSRSRRPRARWAPTSASASSACWCPPCSRPSSPAA